MQSSPRTAESTISENVLAKSNLAILEREGVLEDTHNITELKHRKVAISIKESDLAYLDMRVINREISENIVRGNLDKYENSMDQILIVLGIVDDE